MKRRKTLIFTLLLTFFFIGEAYAKEAIEKFSTGSINWTQGVVSASGMGPVKKSLRGTARGKLIARRIAIVDCQRNLLETTKGVRLTSTTVVRNAILESDTIETKVNGLVKNAEIVNETFDQDRVYRVTMKMPLAGKFLGAVLKKTCSFPRLIYSRIGHLNWMHFLPCHHYFKKSAFKKPMLPNSQPKN